MDKERLHNGSVSVRIRASSVVKNSFIRYLAAIDEYPSNL